MPSKYGNTSPILAISREYGVDWGLCLMFADHQIHGRTSDPVAMVQLYHDPQWPRIAADIMDVVDDTLLAHREAEQLEREDRLVFSYDTGKWSVADAK